MPFDQSTIKPPRWSATLERQLTVRELNALAFIAATGFMPRCHYAIRCALYNFARLDLKTLRLRVLPDKKAEVDALVASSSFHRAAQYMFARGFQIRDLTPATVRRPGGCRSPRYVSFIDPALPSRFAHIGDGRIYIDCVLVDSFDNRPAVAQVQP